MAPSVHCLQSYRHKMDVSEIICPDGSYPKPWKPSSPVRREAVYFESLPSYDDFFKQIFMKNQLCILGPSCTTQWTSRKLWVNERGSPDLDFLNHRFGHAKAPVANCNAEEFCSHPKTEMVVSDFIDYWKRFQMAGHPPNDECLYLKDWHFTRDFPSFHAYSPPNLLCSDWLNEFWDVRQDDGKGDDYRFVYMGPQNTWTPFHSDVLRSYSWSANICGQKKWIFFPPGDEDKLKDRYGQLVYDLRDPSLKDVGKFPHAETVMDNAIVIIQNPGEIVFVPSGWHHQVFNLEDTISINHNWLNGASAHLTWAFLKARLTKVKVEIADCSEMEGFDSQCQKILKADSGMDYLEFYKFMATIARHRIVALEAFCNHKLEQKTDINTNTESSTTTAVHPNTEYLCLWNAALHNSTTLCAKTGCEKPDLQDLIVSNHSGMPLCLDSTSPKFTSKKGENHQHCPHWAHCGLHLAVFDLQRTRDIIGDVIEQPEWNSVLIESEGDSVLVDNQITLIAGIEETLIKCLGL